MVEAYDKMGMNDLRDDAQEGAREELSRRSERQEQRLLVEVLELARFAG